MSKRKMKLTLVVSVLIAFTLAFGGCAVGFVSEHNKVYKPFVWQNNLPTTATTLSLPSGARNIQFLGADLAQFSLANGAMGLFDLAANSVVINATMSGANSLYLGFEVIEESALSDQVYILGQRANDRWSVYARNGARVFEGIEAGEWTTVFHQQLDFADETELNQLIASEFGSNARVTLTNVEPRTHIESGSVFWYVVDQADLEMRVNNFINTNWRFLDIIGTPSWEVVDINTTWNDYTVKFDWTRATVRVEQGGLLLEILADNVIMLNNDVYTLSNNNAPTRIIRDSSGDIGVLNGVIYDHGDGIVYDMGGNVVYIPRQQSGMQFMPLSRSRGVYWTTQIMPEEASNRNFDFVLNGEKIRQIVQTVNFSNGNRSTVRFDYYIGWIVPISRIAGYAEIDGVPYNDRMLSNFIVTALRPSVDKIVDVYDPDGNIVNVIVNDRFNAVAKIYDDTIAQNIGPNRYLATSAIRNGVQLTDSRGNIIKFFSGSSNAQFDKQLNLISAVENGVGMYYGLNGELVIDGNDYFGTIGTSYGHILLYREVTEGTNTITEIVSVNNRGEVVGVVTSNRTTDTSYIEQTYEGIIFMGNSTNNNLVLRNFANAPIAVAGSLTTDNFVNISSESRVGNVYILTSNTDGSRNIIRIS